MGPSFMMVEKLERNNIKRLNEMQPFLAQQGIEIAVDLSPYAYYVIERTYPLRQVVMMATMLTR